MTEQHLQYDVVVVGYGSAGAVAALEAARAGAKVLLVEKLEHLGGNSVLSAGFVRIAENADKAAAYLTRACGTHVPRPVIEVVAQGMTQLIPYLQNLAHPLGAEVFVNVGAAQGEEHVGDLYDWEGWETFGWAGIQTIPGFSGYPWLHFAKWGQSLMRALEAALDRVQVEVWFQTTALRLIYQEKQVVGITVQRDGEIVNIFTRGGVILACGGFEFDARLLRSFMELPVIYPIGSPGNTGDGIRMAGQVGASLWHMWHVHGSYGFKFPNYPIAFRNHLGGVRRSNRPVPWILIDQQGRRFMNEVPKAPQDTGARPFAHLDSETGNFDRIPAWMIFDEAGRKLGPIAKTISSVPEHFYEWSADNSVEIERGWILCAQSLEELAAKTAVPIDNLCRTIARWSEIVSRGKDDDFQRPSGTFVPIGQLPFYAVPVYPVVTNTQGGLQHDAHYRVVDTTGQPIVGLYTAGELSSIFGHIYMLGGNLAECLIGGWTAGRHAAQRA